MYVKRKRKHRPNPRRRLQRKTWLDKRGRALRLAQLDAGKDALKEGVLDG